MSCSQMSVLRKRFEPACESHVGINPGAGETKKARVRPSRIGAASEYVASSLAVPTFIALGNNDVWPDHAVSEGDGSYYAVQAASNAA